MHQEGPDISLLDPALQRQWDHAANAQLGNIVVKPHSHRVWWTSDQCPVGNPHSWSAAVYHRTNGTLGCPQCTSHKVCKHKSLASKAPRVAAQWDYEEEDGTTGITCSEWIQSAGQTEQATAKGTLEASSSGALQGSFYKQAERQQATASYLLLSSQQVRAAHLSQPDCSSL